VSEILVGREQCQIVSDAQLGQQSIDSADLYASPAAIIPQLGGPDMIVAIGTQERKRGESIEYSVPRPWSREALQQLLQDKAGRKDSLPLGKGSRQGDDLSRRLRLIAPEGKGPDAGVNEEAQSRFRSAL
jgi:hypothetical protein